MDNIGSDMETENFEPSTNKPDIRSTKDPTYATLTFLQSHSGYEDPTELEPIPPEFQFEEIYSRYENAVLDNTASGPEEISNEISSPHPMGKTCLIQNEENKNGNDISTNTSCISLPLSFSNINSDSMSSMFSNSSAASTSHTKPQKYLKNRINEE